MRQIGKQILTINALATFVFVAGLSASFILLPAMGPDQAIAQEDAQESAPDTSSDEGDDSVEGNDSAADEMPAADGEAGNEMSEDEGEPEIAPVPIVPPKPGWLPFDFVEIPENLDEVDQPAIGPFLTDPLTGVAMNGFDPVSFFVSDAPSLGDETLEYYWGGISWYFSSKANLEAFRRAPEFYVPQFGGYGTIAMARGFLSQGEPLIYQVLDGELFLFFSASNKSAFALIRNSARLDARQNWVQLRTNLVRN